MPQIRMRERNQITIPMAISDAAGLQPNDALDVTYINGVITIIPVSKKTKKLSFMDFVGSAEGIWGKTDKEIDQTLRDERKSWER